MFDNLQFPDSVDNAVKNLTDKPTQNIGTTFGDIWFLVFGGVSQKAAKKRIKYSAELEQYKQEIENSTDLIPSDKKLEPSIQITAQALENSKYCIEEPELRKMFSSLIANSMNSDFSNQVHPAFAEMIKQMSPLDAKVLTAFKKNPNGFPVVNYQNVLDGSGYRVLAENVFIAISMDNYQQYAQSLTSLERLGLISIHYDEFFTQDSLYEQFKSHPLYLSYKAYIPEKNLKIQKGKTSLTPLGRSFVNVCIPD